MESPTPDEHLEGSNVAATKPEAVEADTAKSKTSPEGSIEVLRASQRSINCV